MNTEDLKSLALKHCIEIYNEYEESEVFKFAPRPVISAWKVGRDYIETEHVKTRKRIKGFEQLFNDLHRSAE